METDSTRGLNLKKIMNVKGDVAEPLFNDKSQTRYTSVFLKSSQITLSHFAVNKKLLLGKCG